VAAQIAALQKVETSLSPAERKLDSRLAVTLRRRAGATRIPRAVPGARVSRAGTALVDIRAGKAGPDLLKRLERERARIVSGSGRGVRARVPLSALETVASWSGVRRVDVATDRMTHEIVSEGDIAHAADLARRVHGVTGVGTKICALSDGVDSLADSQDAGELPDVDVLPDQEGDGDEGTAMLEILHDVAPGRSWASPPRSRATPSSPPTSARSASTRAAMSSSTTSSTSTRARSRTGSSPAR
jgi:hypothetical protein